MGAIRNAKCCLEHFGESSCLQEITPQKIEGFVIALRDAGNSNPTINRKLAALSKMLRYSYNMEWTDRIPKIEKTKESKNRIRWLTKQEEEKLKDVLLTLKRPELVNLVTFLVDTGARVGEALRLEWRDVAEHQVTFWDTKNGESRSKTKVAPLPPSINLLSTTLGTMPETLWGLRRTGSLFPTPFAIRVQADWYRLVYR
jgi:integrase